MNISPFLIPVVAIVGAFVYVIIKTLAQSRVRELEIGDGTAMMECVLAPAPDTDARGFARAMSRLDSRSYRGESRGGGHRRAGVTMMGVGFGLMVLIAFTSGEESIAVGVGGFLV